MFMNCVGDCVVVPECVGVWSRLRDWSKNTNEVEDKGASKFKTHTSKSSLSTTCTHSLFISDIEMEKVNAEVIVL